MERSYEKSTCLIITMEQIMQGNYVQIMMDSLKKKEAILEEINKKNIEQKEVVEAKEVSFDRFDQIVEDKSVLIEQLQNLDQGFELLYENVKQVLQTEDGKAKYRNQIKEMQDSIRRITEKSAAIQVQEQRNKQAIETMFRNEKEKLKTGKVSSTAAVNYYKTMNQTNFVSPQFVDKKK